MISNLKIGVFLLSGLGLFLSLVSHILLFLNVNVQDFPISPFILHAGIFITFAPALILFISENKNSKDENGRKNTIKLLYKDSPFLLRVIVFAFYIYAIGNFLYFMGSMNGGPNILENGNYVLSNHGKEIKEISFDEYQKYRRLEVRGFSGHWMLFYSASLLLSYPFRKKREIIPEKERKLVDKFENPFVRFELRLFEKGKFLFILSAISIPLFVFVIIYYPIFILIAVTVIFPINLLLNFYYFIKWSKFFIKSYSIENDFIEVEVYKYNTLSKYKFNLWEIQIKLNEKPVRGGELISLVFSDLKNKELFYQFESNEWSPNQLVDLEKAFLEARKVDTF